MFSNNDLQYVSVVKYHNQLKLDYKLLNQEEIISSNQSAFLLHNEYMPEDAVFKLNNWQKEINNTYFSTLSNSEEQIIINKDDNSKNSDYTISKLNTNHNVGIKKSVLFEEIHYFEKTGVDFAYSPYHILNLHVEQNPSANSLVSLVLDDHLYLIILNENSEIIYNTIEKLTSFDDIKKTEFYESEVIGQKLFDEVYYFEIQNSIKKVIENFYMLQGDVFIEQIVILYTLKQLNDEQINSLKDDFLIDINYHPISIDESLYELSKVNQSLQKSFIQPRKKPTNSKLTLWIIASILTTVLAVGLFFYFKIEDEKIEIKNDETKKIVKEVTKTEVKKEIPDIPKSVLPNHIIKNSDVGKRLMSLFDIIPDDVLLKEITLKRNDSIIEATFLKDDIYIKTMKNEILKFYKYSEIKFEDIDASILNATIYNTERIFDKNPKVEIEPKYIKDEFLPQDRVFEQLKAMFPQNGIIKFKSTFNSEVTTFNYLVNIIVDTPLEFFEIIDDMNKELYSMNIDYPVMMRKTIDGIEIEFALQFHQEK